MGLFGRGDKSQQKARECEDYVHREISIVSKMKCEAYIRP